MTIFVNYLDIRNETIPLNQRYPAFKAKLIGMSTHEPEVEQRSELMIKART